MKYLLKITLILMLFIPFAFSDDEQDDDLFAREIGSYVQLNSEFMYLCDYQNINWDNNTLFIPERTDTEFSIYDILLHHWVSYISYEGNLEKDTVVTFTVPISLTYQVSSKYEFYYHFEKNHFEKNDFEKDHFSQNETHFYLEQDQRKVLLPWPTNSKEVNRVQYQKGKLKLKKFVEFKMTLTEFISIVRSAKDKLDEIEIKSE